MKIAVVGMGYVGLSISTLLSQKHEVVALDIIPEKVKMINSKICPIKDNEIEEFFKKKINLRATLDYKDAFKCAKYIIICTPTNYDESKTGFDTSSVEDVIRKYKCVCDDNTTIIIKSTVPVGFVKNIKEKYNINDILFCPEFLREGNALYDNLYPSRIIIGGISNNALEFANILSECAYKKEIPIRFMDSSEAEAVKLFSNAYLALRIAFFNELDTYAELKKLNSRDIIEGVGLDPRIGCFYNNPSFGYGGYCLPKDTKQLLATYNDIPQNLIKAIINSNITRKKHITNMVTKNNNKNIGIYRLTMKKNSDNFRTSAIYEIIDGLKEKCNNVYIYEPALDKDIFNGCKVINNFEEFNKKTDIILANRMEDNLNSVRKKVYTRDLFYRD